MTPRRALAVLTSLIASMALVATAPGSAGAAPGGERPGHGPARGQARALATSPELSTSTRLADRRSIVLGDRFYEVGAEDATYPGMGFHTTAEMGGFWSMPIKLLDGVWFGVDGSWLKAQKYTSGWGYARMDLGTHGGVRVQRTDGAPDGVRAGLIGLTLSSSHSRTIRLTLDAHSELMGSYPWGSTTPSQSAYNLPDTGSYRGGNLVFREQGTPPVAGATRHDWAAVVGSHLTPVGHALGSNYRGPQSADVICPSTGTTPPRCDDSAYGRGTGGQLEYAVKVPAGSRTVWFAVGGSDKGLSEALSMQRRVLVGPDALLARKVASRKAIDRQSQVQLPGDPLLQQSVAWSKQNIADARQESRDLQLRVTNAGTKYPAPVATLPEARWIGAGWPDYPWMFGTDGEYTAFAAVASGQFQAIEDHLRSLRDVSDAVNDRSGKVAHEVVPDGSVYFGANSDPGNTDETVKFPSAVALVWRWTGDNSFRDAMYDFAVRNMRYVYSHLDADGDGWPEGAGNVERAGMGQEKLDNSVYAIRGLLDLADLAASKHDAATESWARARAANLQSRFEQTWWNGAATKSYADSLADPGNHQLFQRYWIGLTPVEAEKPAAGSQPAAPVADLSHARETVAQHELPCYTGEFGLFHTGTGGTSDPAGNKGPTCDPAISSAPSDREVFTLGTSVAAVAEAALGRMGAGQLQRYTTDLARVQLDPSVWETPGAMPEISPSPDFGANIDKKLTERSMALQAWGTYGVLWPVVHFELGVAPDLGQGTVAIVPQVPDGQSVIAGRDIRLGSGSVDVAAARAAHWLVTAVHSATSARVTVGAVLPTGTSATDVTLNGRSVPHQSVTTARGSEIRVDVPRGTKVALLVVAYR